MENGHCSDNWEDDHTRIGEEINLQLRDIQPLYDGIDKATVEASLNELLVQEEKLLQDFSLIEELLNKRKAQLTTEINSLKRVLSGVVANSFDAFKTKIHEFKSKTDLEGYEETIKLIKILYQYLLQTGNIGVVIQCDSKSAKDFISTLGDVTLAPMELPNSCSYDLFEVINQLPLDLFAPESTVDVKYDKVKITKIVPFNKSCTGTDLQDKFKLKMIAPKANLEEYEAVLNETNHSDDSNTDNSTDADNGTNDDNSCDADNGTNDDNSCDADNGTDADDDNGTDTDNDTDNGSDVDNDTEPDSNVNTTDTSDHDFAVEQNAPDIMTEYADNEISYYPEMSSIVTKSKPDNSVSISSKNTPRYKLKTRMGSSLSSVTASDSRKSIIIDFRNLSGGCHLEKPSGVAFCSETNKLLVADSILNAVLEIELEPNSLGIHHCRRLIHGLSCPIDIAVSALSGLIFVVDAGKNWVAAFSRYDGVCGAVFPIPIPIFFIPNSEYRVRSVTAYDGFVLITITNQFRVLIYDEMGKLHQQIKINQTAVLDSDKLDENGWNWDFYGPICAVLSPSQELIVPVVGVEKSANFSVYILNLDGEELQRISYCGGGPRIRDLAVDFSGFVYRLYDDRTADAVTYGDLLYSYEDVALSRYTMCAGKNACKPSGMALITDGWIAVADADNCRVEIMKAKVDFQIDYEKFKLGL